MSCDCCRGYSVSYCPVCGESITEEVTCPDCGGTGHGPYYKFDTIERRDIECSEEVYNLLPEDEDEAEEMGERYCKQDVETCPTCRGDGVIVREIY